MKKIQGSLLALFMVFASGAVATSTAFAEETEYLTDGGVVSSGQQLEMEGELLLTDHKGGLFGEEIMILCSIMGLAEFLSSTDADILTTFALGERDPLSGSAIIPCSTQSGSCSESATKFGGLPWLLELVLEGTSVSGLLRPSIAESPRWFLGCFGNIVEDECRATLIPVSLTNEAIGVIDMTFQEALTNCERGGAGAGLSEGLLILLSAFASVEVMGS